MKRFVSTSAFRFVSRGLCSLVVGGVIVCAALFVQRMWVSPDEPENGQSHANARILDEESEFGLIPYQLNEKSFGPKTLSKIQSDSGVSLPAGCRGLWFVYSPPIDPSWAAKIEIPKGAEASLLAELSKLPDKKINIFGEMGPTMPWWRTKEATVLLDRQSSPLDNYLRTTLAHEGGATVLYIEWAVF